MYIIIWIICGFAAAAIASGKNRSSLGWFFLGLLISIFAVIIVACLPKLEPDLRETHRKCPHCAEPVLKEAKVCKHCHKDLPAEDFSKEIDKCEYVRRFGDEFIVDPEVITKYANKWRGQMAGREPEFVMSIMNSEIESQCQYIPYWVKEDVKKAFLAELKK